MPFDLKLWTEIAEKHRNAVMPVTHGGPQITHAVSKTFKGETRQDYNSSICKSPEECAHLHIVSNLDCKSLDSYRCDSRYSREHLRGEVKSNYSATFGHDEAQATGRDLVEERGYFYGNFDIDAPNGPTRGMLDGLCNVGLIHEPVGRHEECNEIGRWYGRLHASVPLPGRETGFLIAAIALQVKYDVQQSWLGIEFAGTLEGMLIRHCEKPG